MGSMSALGRKTDRQTDLKETVSASHFSKRGWKFHCSLHWFWMIEADKDLKETRRWEDICFQFLLADFQSWMWDCEGADLHPRCSTVGCEFLSRLSTESTISGVSFAVVAWQQTQHSSESMMVYGDFNQVCLSYTLYSSALFVSWCLFSFFSFLYGFLTL